MLKELLQNIESFISENFGDGLRIKVSDTEIPEEFDRKKLFSVLNNFIKTLQAYQSDLKKQIDEETSNQMEIDVESVEEESNLLGNSESSDDVDTKSGSTTLQDIKETTQSVTDTAHLKNQFERKEEKADREIDTANIVQIQAPKSEIDRRISAFIEQKRMEVDEHNRKEFCSALYTVSDIDESCARVDSVFVSRVGGKSHIKVSRVVNLQGPQTQITSPLKQNEGTAQNSINAGVEERLRNMESHLKMKRDSSLNKSDLFTRLKNLEERILYLESLSPEYFSMPSPKRKKIERKQEKVDLHEQVMSLSEIDKKMEELQKVLRGRTPDD